MNNKYTKEILQRAVNSCSSLRKLILHLGLKETGGNRKHLKRRLIDFDIDTSNWKATNILQGWSKGLKNAKDNINFGKYSKEEMFKENSLISTKTIKNYLIGEKDFVHHCQICKNTEWCNQPISLDLDHINGNNRDNKRENLRFICPNCHAQTKTYRGKNINKNRLKVSDDQFIKVLKESKTIKQALIQLGLTPKGANYSKAYSLIVANNITHFFKLV